MMNKLFMGLVLLLSMAFGSLFYLAKCGHGGDAFVGGAFGSMLGTTVANNMNRSQPQTVEVVERPSSVSSSRIADIEDQLDNLRKKIRALETRVESLESAKS